MPESTSTAPFIARHKKSVLTFLLFIAYASAVFWSNYLSLQRAQENATTRFRLEAEKQASAISYFFLERRIDTTELAESEPIVNFFRNRDMGMSYQYGLGVNVQLIEDRFEYIANKLQAEDTPVFSGFMLIDSYGSVVAQREAPDPSDSPGDFLQPENHTPRTRLGKGDGKVIIAAPVWIDETYRGELLVWIDARASFTQFGGSHVTSSGFLLDRETGSLVFGDANIAIPNKELVRLLEGASGKARPEVISYQDGGDRYNIARIDVDQTPMAFIPISKEEGGGSGTARLFVIAAGVLPLIVLLAGFMDVI